MVPPPELAAGCRLTRVLSFKRPAAGLQEGFAGHFLLFFFPSPLWERFYYVCYFLTKPRIEWTDLVCNDDGTGGATSKGQGTKCMRRKHCYYTSKFETSLKRRPGGTRRTCGARSSRSRTTRPTGRTCAPSARPFLGWDPPGRPLPYPF